MPELIGLAYSPWTEKARWALDHHGVDYRYREHLILFGMPELRWKTKEFTRELTVPTLITPRQSFFDSFTIAQFADKEGRGSPLLPPSRLSEIEEWNRVSESALDAGRGVLVQKILDRPEALKEAMPPFMRAMGTMLLPLARFGTNYVARAFDSKKKSIASHVEIQRQALTRIREGLKSAGGRYLLGQFSYADIAACVALQPIAPVDQKFIAIGPATRACWTNEELAREFADLCKWRDSIYQKHRERKSS